MLPDDRVVIRIARSEMGQGTLTGLAQLVAEELECDWAKVSTEQPTPGQNLARNRVWGNFSTGGSRGIRESHDYVRKGGATARLMLVQAAADEWKVPVGECRAANSVITHAPIGSQHQLRQGGRRRRQAHAAGQRAAEGPEGLEAHRQAGACAWTPRTSSPARRSTAWTCKLPGMLNAAIKDCPVFGGKVKSFDAAAIASRPGVKKVVAVGDSAVAVVADTWWHAKTALDALPIVWDEGANATASSAAFAAVLKAGLDAPEAVVGNSHGDARAALAAAPRKFEAVYAYPHQNHATMETMNATARWTPDALRGLDADAERRGRARRHRPRRPGCRPAQCEVYKINLGGGFGRRGAVHDWVRQAVAIAKELPGTPVKLIWSREEDMRHGRYHPVTHVQAQGRAGRAGQPDGAAHAHLGPVDPGRRVPAEHPERPRPGGLPGPERARPRSLDRLQRAEPADRPRDAQPARCRRASGAAST